MSPKRFTPEHVKCNLVLRSAMNIKQVEPALAAHRCESNFKGEADDMIAHLILLAAIKGEQDKFSLT